jgi:hypothetical protein
MISGSLQSMLQATVGHGLSLDPLSFCQDGRAAPEVDVGWGKIVDAFVVTAVVVLVDERGDLRFEISRQEIVSNRMRFLNRSAADSASEQPRGSPCRLRLTMGITAIRSALQRARSAPARRC